MEKYICHISRTPLERVNYARMIISSVLSMRKDTLCGVFSPVVTPELLSLKAMTPENSCE